MASTHGMEVKLHLGSNSTFKFPNEWVLLLPSVGVGNVGQLAIDLLLSSFEAEQIGHIHSASILPFVAPAPNNTSHSTTMVFGMELYRLQNASSNIFIIQQRSPSVQGRTESLAQQLMTWAIDNGCTQVLLVTSANSAGFRGRQVLDPGANFGANAAFRLAFSSAAAQDGKLGARAMAVLNCKALENIDADSRGWSETVCDNVQLDLLEKNEHIPAFAPAARKGSYVRSLLQECERRNVAITALMLFVHEGDNIMDSCCLATAVKDVLQLGNSNGVGKDLEGSHASDDAGRFRWNLPQSWLESSRVPKELF